MLSACGDWWVSTLLLAGAVLPSCAPKSEEPPGDSVGGAGGSAGSDGGSSDGGSGNGGSGNGGSGNGGSGNGGSGNGGSSDGGSPETGGGGEPGDTSTDGAPGGTGAGGSGAGGSGGSSTGGSGGSGGVCAEGWVPCDGTCIDPQRDLRFCGASGNCEGLNRGTRCADLELCKEGSCPGSWQQPQMLAEDGSVSAVALAMNDAGDAMATWHHHDLSGYAYTWGGAYTPEGGWHKQVIDQVWADSKDSRVAIDESGNATMLRSDWEGLLQGAYRGAGSDWQVDFVRALGDGFAVTLDVTVAVDASGTALAAWTEGDELWWNQHSPDGGWGAVEQLQSADSRTPLLAMNPQGDAMLVWSRTEEVGSRLWAIRSDLGVEWTAPEPIHEASDDDALPGTVVLDSLGNGLVVWRQHADRTVWANRFAVGVGWGAAQLLDTTEVEYNTPHAAMDADGNAVVVWIRSDGGKHTIWSSRSSPSSGWGEPELISGTGAGCDNPRVAVGASGDAVAVWDQVHPVGGSAVWSNRYLPDVGWGDPELIDLETGGGLGVEVGVDASGNAIAVWSEDNWALWANFSAKVR